MSMSLYSLSKSYTNQWLFAQKNTKASSLLSTSQGASLDELISKYSYLKKNYKDIKSELNKIGKDDTKSSTSKNDKTSDLEKTAKSQAKIIIDTKLSAGDLKDSINKLSNAICKA